MRAEQQALTQRQSPVSLRKTRLCAVHPATPMKYPRQGLNSSADSAGNAAIPNRGGAESGAVGDENGVLTVPDDPRLLVVIDAWPGLSEETRDAIARLAGDDVEDLDDVTATPDGEAVS